MGNFIGCTDGQSDSNQEDTSAPASDTERLMNYGVEKGSDIAGSTMPQWQSASAPVLSTGVGNGERKELQVSPCGYCTTNGNDVQDAEMRAKLTEVQSNYKRLRMKYDKIQEECQQIKERNLKLSRQIIQLKPTGLDEKLIINHASEQMRRDYELHFETLLQPNTGNRIKNHLNKHLKQSYEERDTRELLHSIFKVSYYSWKEVITRQSDLFDDLFNVHEHVIKKKMDAICSHYQEVVVDMNVDSKVKEVTSKVFEKVDRLQEHMDTEKEWLRTKDQGVDTHDSTHTENTGSKLLDCSEIPISSISTLEEFVQTSVKIAWKMVSLVPPMVADWPNTLNAKDLQQLDINDCECPTDSNIPKEYPDSERAELRKTQEVHSIHYSWNPDLSLQEYQLVYFRPVLYCDYNGQKMLNAIVTNKQCTAENSK